MYNFDEVIDRDGTYSSKWSPTVLNEKFGESKMLSYWVADMDFRTAPAVVKAVTKQAEHGIYGYSEGTNFRDAFISWVSRRFNWTIQPEWIVNTPGVVNALSIAVNTFCQPGDKVLIQNPVYYPFEQVIEKNQCEIVSSNLYLKDDQYWMDFEDFEQKAKDPNVKLFILCSPHNPVSRLWTKEELARVMDICLANDILVVSDEIHSDLVFPGEKHHILASLDKKYEQNVITCLAPSKTFNLAGMIFSNIVIPNPVIREQFQATVNQFDLNMMSPFAMAAVYAAYTEGEEWLEELLVYLKGNFEFTKEYLRKHLPKVKFIRHQATYLAWLDFRDYGLTDKDLEDVIYHDAKVAMDGGTWFSEQGSGFMRLNMACPRSLLEEGLERVVKAVTNKYGK